MAEAPEMSDVIKTLESKLNVYEGRFRELEQASKQNIIVNSVKDRKIPVFDPKQDADDWVQNVVLFLDKKSFSEAEKISWILDHLPDDTKTEIRLEIDVKRCSARELLDLLKQVYGVKQSQNIDYSVK
jgi:hypothetical protein